MNFRKIYLVMAINALVGMPLVVQADQIEPNPNHETITINPTDSAWNEEFFENFGTIDNWGGLENNGTLNNLATINNYSGATLENWSGPLYNQAGATLTNYGSLYNFTEIDNYSGGLLNNYGFLSNSWGGILRNYGTLNNYAGGTLDNWRKLYNEVGGTLNNYGLLHNDCLHHGKNIVENRGTLYNKAGGTIYSGSKLDNYGTLVNEAGATVYHCYGTLNNYSGGILINQGNLTGNLGTLNNWGVLANEAGGTLDSFDQLNNWATVTNHGTILGYEALNNKSGGTLDNYGTLTNYFTLANDAEGTLNNYGTLTNENYAALSNEGLLTNSGTLTNEGVLNGDGTYLQTAGQTINDGSLSQTLIDIQAGSLSGTGTITGAVNLADGATVHAGNSPGILTINGDFNSSGILQFDFAGLDTGEYSVLDIKGNASFSGGSLEFIFIDDYQPLEGDSWDFLFFDSITGWDQLTFALIGLSNGYIWSTELFSDHATLLIIQAQAVPLPSALLLFGTCLGILALYNRKLLKKNNLLEINRQEE